MADKPEAVAFRNKATKKVWAVNVGTHAHKRMIKGLATGEYESADMPSKARSRASKATSQDDKS